MKGICGESVACSMHKEKKNVYIILLGRIERKRQLGKHLGKTQESIEVGP
jgi:hypothetical protein